MSLESQIQTDLVTAMKAKESEKVTVLRAVKSAFGNYAIEKGKNDVTDEEAVQIIQKQAKQRRESIESFTQAGRTELAEKEKSELQILEAYLPEQLGDEDLESIIKGVIEETGAQSKAEIGNVMKSLMPKVKGKADGKRVNAIVAKHLN